MRNVARLVVLSGLFLLMVMGCWSTVWGQMPKAVVTGPKETISGDMVKLDGSQSQGLKYAWKLAYALTNDGRIPCDKSFYPQDNGTSILFSAGVRKETTFTFLLVVSGTNPNGGPEMDMAFHDLKIKPLYPEDPKPDPTLPPSPNPSKVTRVTYIYQKNSNAVPEQVARALQRINADSSLSVAASEFEEDTTDGDKEVPDQYKAALEAAKKAGLPALVAQAGDTVVRVIANPKTEAQVMEVLR